MNGISDIVFFDLLAAIFVIGAILVRAGLNRLGIPPLVGFLLFGFFLRCADEKWSLLSPEGISVIEFLASIGVFVLLFRVGLESNLHGLISKLPRATPVWAGNTLLSGGAAYVVSAYVLEMAAIPSLFIAAALTATSVAVSAEVWREAGALSSPNGELFVDVAELDDISGILLMVILIGAAPLLKNEDNSATAAIVMTTTLWLIVKACGFAALLYFAARFGKNIISHILRTTVEPDSILFVVGTGLLISAFAAALGFSMAIGGFFAGAFFSRDPLAIKLESLFLPLHALFAPFFFIAVGSNISPDSLTSAMGIGGVLLVVAILAKIVGAGVPALMTTGCAGAAVIGVSMVPRAEISMVIAQQGNQLGEWALPGEAYASLALVSIVTCIISPIAIRWIIRNYPHSTKEQT